MLRSVLATGGTQRRSGEVRRPRLSCGPPALRLLRCRPEGLLGRTRAIAGPSAVLGPPSLTLLRGEGWLRTVVELRHGALSQRTSSSRRHGSHVGLVPVDESRRPRRCRDVSLLLAETEASAELVLRAPLGRLRPVGEEVGRWFKELGPLEAGEVAGSEIVGWASARAGGSDRAEAVYRDCTLGQTTQWSSLPRAGWLRSMMFGSDRRAGPAYSSGLVAGCV